MTTVNRKDLEELKRKAAEYDKLNPSKARTPDDADAYAAMRGMRTDLGVQRELNIGLKDIYNSMLKYAPDARLLGQEFVDYMVEHKFKLYGAHKALHRNPVPWGMIAVLLGVLGIVYAFNQNADGISTYFSDPNNQGFIIIFLGILGVIAWIVYRRRS